MTADYGVNPYQAVNMPFQTKDFASIVASQINHARSVTDKITDFQPGSVVRTIMEAPAVELEEFYMQVFLGLRDAIPVATFLSFGFDKLPAARGHGFVSISKVIPPAEDIAIPVGTEFTSLDGRVYLSTVAVTWEAGTNVVRVPVAASQAGLVGNIAVGQITSSSMFGDGFAISNSAIETGRDPENDREREARFAEFVRALSRGTFEACKYAAKQSVVLDEDGNIYEYVTRIGVYEPPGYVRIFVYSSRGVPTPELIADGQRRLDGWKDEITGAVTPGFRSAGVRVEELPMTERVVSASISVEMFPGSELTESVELALYDVFATAIRAVQPEQTLYIGTLVELLLGVQGVRTVIPSVNENIACAVNEALIPGVLAVNPL